MNLEQTQPLLESVLNSVGAGIIVADREGNFLLYNPAAVEMLGRGATLAPPETWSDFYGFFHEDCETPLREEELPLVRAMRGESVNNMRIFVRNQQVRDGIWLNINGRPLKDAAGAVTGGVIAVHDITKQQQLEIAIQKSNQELEQFASIAAHDLQEPLRTIVSFLNLLEQRLGPQLTEDAKSTRYLNNVVLGAKRMQGLITDLLAYSRIRSKGRPFERVNLNQLLKLVMADLGESLQETGAQVSVDELPIAYGDRSQLKHLFQNLINNAVKFRSPDKAPVIRIGVSELNQRSGLATFFVQDNGIGIDPKFHQRIFVVFQRLHDMESYPGTGIGLALCKQIVERHNGRIFVESTEGSGSTFYFSLPFENADEPD